VLERLLGNDDLRSRLGAQAGLDAPEYTWKARAEHALAGFIQK
jgi:hypothetical protein